MALAPGKYRKRSYRVRVKCSECEKEIDSDYKEKHKEQHPGKNVVFARKTESNQATLSFVKKPKLFAIETPMQHQTDTCSMTEPISPANSASSPSESQSSRGLPSVAEASEPGPSVAIESSDEDDDSCNEIDDDDYFEDRPTDEPSNINLTTTDGPNQPRLDRYDPKSYKNEHYSRDFNAEWYKSHPWLEYDPVTKRGKCYACRVFMNNDDFQYKNWKKKDRVTKHVKSKRHEVAITKWMDFRVAKKRNLSVLTLMDSAHHKQVARNRDYIRVIIEYLIFTTQQNIAQRGKHEDRSSIHEISDINRGNFLELLHMRCKDIPWLAQDLKSRLDTHAQWTSPDICNEILAIVADLVIKMIKAEVDESRVYSLNMNETSDISRTEQVAMCLRYIFQGKTKESFIGFCSVKSTDGESLYNLVLEVFQKLDLPLNKIVGECFDGASSMSGIRRGLATRVKECSPLGIYVHCCGHLLNLAIQDSLTALEPLRNTLGVIQSLYNFLEASPKRHAHFKDINVDDENDVIRSLKSQSVTRWSCRWEAAKAVINQLPRITKALLELANDGDPKTYTDSRSLLTAIADFDFVLGLVILKLILENTSSLSKYLQGKSIDVISAKRNAHATIETLRNCRNDNSFELVWSQTERLCEQMKRDLEESDYLFKDARIPRTRKPPRRLEALMGTADATASDDPRSPNEHHRIKTYFPCLDKVIGEMESRFDMEDQKILCALGDVVLNEKSVDTSFNVVGEYYNLDYEIIQSEIFVFLNLIKLDENRKKGCASLLDTAAKVVEYMCDNDQDEILIQFVQCPKVLAAIPATSCSAERSFSGLMRLKTYLRNTMGQERVNNLAILNIERLFTNRVMLNKK